MARTRIRSTERVYCLIGGLSAMRSAEGIVRESANKISMFRPDLAERLLRIAVDLGYVTDSLSASLELDESKLPEATEGH